MFTRSKVLLLAVALASISHVYGQVATCNSATVPLCTQGNSGSDVQLKPQAVPTSTTIITAQDAYLKGVTVSNPTAGAITFSLCDRQAAPICVLPAVSIAANTTYVIVWPELRLYWCPFGFTATSSGAGLTYYAGWRQ
jgi:hypothetical protein